MNYFARYGVVVSPQQGLRVLARENVICNVSSHLYFFYSMPVLASLFVSSAVTVLTFTIQYFLDGIGSAHGIHDSFLPVNLSQVYFVGSFFHLTTTNRMQPSNPWQDILSPP